jgi:hypothetical protein
MRDGASFCTACGAKVSVAQGEPGLDHTTQGLIRQPLFIAGVVVVSVLLVATVILTAALITRGPGSSAQQQGQQAQAKGVKYNPKDLKSVLYAFGVAFHNGDQDTVNALFPFPSEYELRVLTGCYNVLSTAPVNQIGVYAYPHSDFETKYALIDKRKLEGLKRGSTYEREF